MARDVRRSGPRPGGDRSVHVQRLRPRDRGRVVPTTAQAEVTRGQAGTNEESLIDSPRCDDAPCGYRRARRSQAPRTATTPPAGSGHQFVRLIASRACLTAGADPTTATPAGLQLVDRRATCD